MAYRIDESAIIHPQFSMVYREHCAEIPCIEILGNEWGDDDIDAINDVGMGEYVTPPAGWHSCEWEFYPHKDALGLIAVYLERDGDSECEICAAAPDS